MDLAVVVDDFWDASYRERSTLAGDMKWHVLISRPDSTSTRALHDNAAPALSNSTAQDLNLSINFAPDTRKLRRPRISSSNTRRPASPFWGRSSPIGAAGQGNLAIVSLTLWQSGC